MRREFTIPLLLLSISFQITTITTVGIMKDNIIQFVAIFTPVKFLFNVKAIKKAKKVWVMAFAITHRTLLLRALGNLDDVSDFI
jgi:hypothetical protein